VPIHRLLQNCAFQPETVAVMTTAFDSVCHALGLSDANHPQRERVANKIIELAHAGECDGDRLRERTLEHFRAT
jgi:hypothetical protein